MKKLAVELAGSPHLKTVILAAGYGSRLWPLSTSEKPKQFQPLINGETLLHFTYELMNNATPARDIFVLTLRGHEQFVFDDLPNVEKSNVISVPERRNTFADTLMALSILGSDPDEPILFKCSDQFVKNPQTFTDNLNSVSNKYSDKPLDILTLFCIKAREYSNNAGYFLTGDGWRVSKFIEKPAEADFRAMQNEGEVYRSPLLYICSKSTCRQALKNVGPALAKPAAALLEAAPEQRETAYLSMPPADISSSFFQAPIDLRAELFAFDYLDIGRFSALYELNSKDDAGNVKIGNVVLGENCKNNFILNQLDQPMVVANLHGMVAVQTQAGSLFTPIENANDVGEIYKTRIIHEK